MTVMSTEEFLVGAAKGLYHHSKSKYQSDSNIFWYEPSLFTLDIDRCSIDDGAFSLSYSLAPINPKDVSLDIKAYFVDEKVKLLQEFSKIKIDAIYANKCYLIPSVVYNRKHFSGLAIQYPKVIRESKLVIYETWHVKKEVIRNSIFDNIPELSFTRKLTIPIKPTKDVNPFDFNVNHNQIPSSQISITGKPLTWFTDCTIGKDSDRYWYALAISHRQSQHITNSEHYTEIGNQTITLNHGDIPIIYLDINKGYAFSEVEAESNADKSKKNRDIDPIARSIANSMLNTFSENIPDSYNHAGFGNYTVNITMPVAINDKIILDRYTSAVLSEAGIMPDSINTPDFQEISLEYLVTKN